MKTVCMDGPSYADMAGVTRPRVEGVTKSGFDIIQYAATEVFFVQAMY